jgi:outer membrane receptor protein involved in Fe transport
MLHDQVIVARTGTVPLPEAPLTASSFSESRLEAAGIRQLTELAARTPGLSLSPTRSTLAIRGFGGRAGVLSSGVGAFADGVYVGDWRFLDAAGFFDTESIEVLRGPQSVALGPGTAGGAVQLHSAPPPMTWQSKVVAEAGSDQLWNLQGLIRGPITDQFAMSVAGSTLQRSAWEGAPRSASDQAARDDQYLRAAFTYHWTNLWYSRVQAMDINREDGALRTALLLNEVALGDLRLKYLASWAEREWADEGETRNAGHELSLYSTPGTPVKFNLGMLYREEETRFQVQRPSPDTDTLSAWLSAEAPVAGRLNLSAGLRYSDREAGQGGGVSEHFWDADLTASYRWQDTQRLYLRLAVGHASPAVPDLAPATANAGKLTTAEFGHKGAFLDGRLQTLLALYRNRPEDLAHAADTSYGLEWEVSWRLVEDWQIGTSWAWADSDRPPLQPQQQLSVFASTDWRWGWADMTLRLDYLYQSGVCPDLQPCKGTKGESARQWDARLSARYREWTLEIYADNLADTRTWYSLPGHDGGTGADGERTAPRQLGLRVVYQLR